ncbi:uncharacterized protein V1516DRAFT_613747, partial [Lipomyces oligophaga]|uniref:uncharacterized protein n=1 Tax=Lipomyces oligophaga TaxID=45792 RepID=UPI0034CF9314
RYPQNYTNDRVKAFIEHFFEADDDASRMEDFLDCFSDSAFYILGVHTVAGRESIRRIKLKIWKNISSRKHEIDVIFPFNQSDVEGQSSQTEFNVTNEFALFGRIHCVLSPEQLDHMALQIGDFHSYLKRSDRLVPAASNSTLLTVEWASRLMISLTDMKVMFYQVYPCTASILED